jgi:ParB-like chromosome segregation protein Spo0J
MKEPEIEIHYVPVDDADPAEYNPREAIKPAAMAKLKRSLLEFGWAVPLTVNIRREANGFPPEEDGHKVLVGGHQRVKAAVDLGMSTVPVVYKEYDPLKEMAANIALNNSEVGGSFDQKQLAAVLKKLDEGDSAMLDATGFSDMQVKQMMKQLEDIPDDPIYPLTPKLSEHYDYAIIFCETEMEWVSLMTMLNLEKAQNYKKDSKAGLGLCHVVSFEDFKGAMGK